MEDRCAVILRVKIGGKGGKNDWDRMASKRLKTKMPRFCVRVLMNLRLRGEFSTKYLHMNIKKKKREFKYIN